MKRSSRFTLQLLVWLIIWILLTFTRNVHTKLVLDNSLLWVSQTLVIGILIFYLAPIYLFKQKYISFLAISVLIIIVMALASSHIVPANQRIIIPPPGREGRPPSKFMMNGLFLAISYLLAVFLETFTYAREQEQKILIQANEHMQTELKLLKSQINPHFLFNSLNNIYSLSVINSEKTQESISYLSNMLRYVLYECDQKQVSLSAEISYIENYIKLFNLKSSKTYNISTRFEVSDSNCNIAPMLLIPFVENAFKHSNIENIELSYLKINLIQTENTIVFEVENTIPETNLTKDKVGGIGIQNVKKRLNILYPDRHRLTINSDTTKYYVQLELTCNA